MANETHTHQLTGTQGMGTRTDLMARKKLLLPARNQAMTDLNPTICGFNGFNTALGTRKEDFNDIE